MKTNPTNNSPQEPTPASLYLVATPIGNLSDISLRALEVLKDVDLIAAEDTRHSKHLLQHYQITTPLMALHEHNETQQAVKVLEMLQAGKSVALISDAGTPIISDPGYRLVDLVKKADIKVVPIPGACALITALIASGISAEAFTFVGFLPARGEVRTKAIESLKNETRSLIFYESTHRILDLIELLKTIMGAERRVCVARELTKTFETIHTDSLENLSLWINKDPMQQKGEFVVIVEAALARSYDESAEECRRILKVLLDEVPLKQAVAITVKLTGIGRKLVYQWALELTSGKPKGFRA